MAKKKTLQDLWNSVKKSLSGSSNNTYKYSPKAISESNKKKSSSSSRSTGKSSSSSSKITTKTSSKRRGGSMYTEAQRRSSEASQVSRISTKTKSNYSAKKKDKKEEKSLLNNKETTSRSLAPDSGRASRDASLVSSMDIGPVKRVTGEEGILKKAKAFEDGYQFGDITKTAGSTVSDVGLSFMKGAGRVGEGVLDLGRYGVANVADKLGANKFADKQRVKAQENSIDNFFKDVEAGIEEYSVLGNKTDNAMETLGGVAPLLATGVLTGGAGLGVAGTTAITSILTGSSSMGSGMTEAYQNDATDAEAWKYGAMKGAIDAGTELLSGGLGKFVKGLGISRGIGELDDIFAQKLTSKISNQVARNFAEYGIKSSGEGLEEILAGVGSAVAKKLTYMEDEELRDLIKDENLMESFIMGTFAGGVYQSGDVVKSTKAGRDFITGYTENEQKVIDKEVENRIKEKEADGVKLTNKEKGKITEEVQNDLEKGYIGIDTIESTLGGETYKNYKSILDQEESLKKAYEDAGRKKEEGLSYIEKDEQRKAYEDAKSKYEAFQKEDNKTRFKQDLDLEMTRIIEKDTFLRESYNEKSRRSQAFEADLTKYDEKQQAVVKKAIDSGILNNTNRTREFVDMVAKISADKGVSFDFTNNEKLAQSGFAVDGKTINGFVKDGNISVNIQSVKALNTVVGHEITHVLEGTELYTELQNAVKEYATTKGDYDTRYKALQALYKDVDNAKIDSEVTADLIGDYLFTDSDFVNRLSADKPNVFQKIYDEIKYLVKTVTGTKEARELEKVKRAFDKAYKESSSIKGNNNTKYSIYLSKNDIPGYLKAGARRNKNRQARYDEGKQMIISSDAEFDEFIQKSIKGNPDEMVAYGKVETKLAEQIKEKSGQTIDVSNAYLELLSNDVQHAYREHEKAKQAGDMDMSIADFIYALKNVNKAEVVNARKYKDGGERTTLAIPTNDGTMMLVELISKSAGTLRLKTGWKITNEKFEQNYKSSLDSTGNNSSTNAVRSNTASTDSISNSNENTTDSKEKFSLAGVDAVTADKDALLRAHLMTNDGSSELEVFQETGWFRGADGKWRFEIDDSEAIVHRKGDAILKKNDLFREYEEKMEDLLYGFIDESEVERLMELEERIRSFRDSRKIKAVADYIDHPKLFDAYPFIANIPVEISEMEVGAKGQYSTLDGITISKDLNSEYMEKVFKKTLLHELQHVIQHYERFAGGANMDTWKGYDIHKNSSKYHAAMKRMDDAFEGGSEEFKNLIRKLNRLQLDGEFGEEYTKVENELFEKYEDRYFAYDNAHFEAMLYMDSEELNDFEKYQMTAGEIEARDTANRSEWGTEERRNKLPTRETEHGVIFAENKKNPFEYQDSNNIAPIRYSLSDDDFDMFAEANTSTEDIAPLGGRDIHDVGKRNVNAYMYDNPEVKSYFQEEAKIMLRELQDSTKGEKNYNAQMAYDTGESGWFGTKRETSAEIAELLDSFKYTYGDIEKGLRAIIDDHGAENIAVAKRLEFVINDRLMSGYTDFRSGYDIPGNEEYAELMRDKTTYSDEAYNDYATSLGDNGVTFNSTVEDIGPVVEKKEATIGDIGPVRAMPKYDEAVDAIAEEQAKNKKEHPLETIRKDYMPKNAKKPTDTDAIAKVVVESEKSKKPKDRKWAIWLANIADKGLPFENLAKKTKNRTLEAKWDMTLSAGAMAQRLIGKGRKEVGVKALNDIKQEVGKTGLMEEFQNYIYHKHNIDRMSLEKNAKEKLIEFHNKSFKGYSPEDIKKIAERKIYKTTKPQTAAFINLARSYIAMSEVKNKPVFGNPMSAEESQKAVDKYEKMHPEFIGFANDVYTYNKFLRQQLIDNGVISQKTADLWDEIYPHYVPVKRINENGNNIDVPLQTNRTGINAPIKRAKGGNQDISDLFNTMAERTTQTFRATTRNSFGVELKNTLGTVIEEGDTSLDEIIDTIDEQEALLKGGGNGQYPTFTVFENGQKVTYQITEEMYEALKPRDKNAFDSKILREISNLRRGLLTEYNPVFLFTNSIKDAQDVLINSQHPLKTYKCMVEAHAQILGKGAWYQEYLNNGGDSNTYFDNKEKAFIAPDKGFKKYAKMFPKGISKVNGYIETIPRLAEYIASRQEGRSIEVSMLDAARVTTNFKAGGDVTKALNRNGVTFLNASVQGAAQQVRNIREANMEGAKGWIKLATKFVVAGIPAFVLNDLIWDEDEDYEDLSEYVKQNYYVLYKTDNGKFFRIPKGRTIAVIQEALTKTADLMTGDDEKDLETYLGEATDFFKFAWENLAPNNPLDNNIFSPIWQAISNRTWYGEELVPENLQKVPTVEQFDESTDSLSKWLGEKTGLSPIKINYLLDQYSGGIGDTFLPMITPEAKSDAETFGEYLSAPMKDKFSTDSVMNNQNVADFYDLKDELNIIANGSHATEDDKLLSVYMDAMNKEIGKLYGEKKEIQESDLSSSEKYNQVREKQIYINVLAEAAVKEANNAEITISGRYATIGEKAFIKTDEGEWRKLSNKEVVQQNRVTMTLGVSAEEYFESEDSEYRWDWAYNNPEYYQVSRAISDDLNTYWEHNSHIYNNIRADKDENGKTINGSKKKKVIEYIEGIQGLSENGKMILLKKYYPSVDDYNHEIIDYLNNRDDISYGEMVTILTQLGFEVDSQGNIYW